MRLCKERAQRPLERGCRRTRPKQMRRGSAILRNHPVSHDRNLPPRCSCRSVRTSTSGGALAPSLYPRAGTSTSERLSRKQRSAAREVG